jgi:hypothetical protein
MTLEASHCDQMADSDASVAQSQSNIDERITHTTEVLDGELEHTQTEGSICSDICNDHPYTEGSRCSTMAYGQESNATFMPKAERLLAELFPTCGEASSTITRISGGGSNRIVGLTITHPNPSQFTLWWFPRSIRNLFGKNKPDRILKYILRTPRNYERDFIKTDHEVAALTYAYRMLKLPIPKLICFDSGAKNTLGQPYMIQEWLPGRNLSDVWKEQNLSISQRKSVIRELVSIFSLLHTHKSDRAGYISPCNETSSPTIVSIWSYEDIKPLIPATPQTTVEFMLDLIKRQRENEKEEFGYDFRHWWQLRKLVIHLYKRGFLPDDDAFYLCHGDLVGRNILVTTDHDSVAISGVLDWDYQFVSFRPKFMAYSAPSWLWEEVRELLPGENEPFYDIEPVDEEKKAWKHYWESLVGEEWCKYANRKEYHIARSLFLVMQFGFRFSHYLAWADEILEEWRVLYPEDDLEDDYNSEDDEPESGESDHKESGDTYDE